LSKRFVFAAGLLFVISALLSMNAIGKAKAPLWIEAAKRQPADLTADLKTLDGQPFSLSEFHSKTLLVNYWATWCKPCKEELPSIGELYKNVHGQGLEIVAVTSEKPAVVREYLKGKNLPFTFVLDPKDTIGKRFKLTIVPSTLVIDDTGKLALRYSGQFDWNDVDFVKELKSILTSTKSAAIQ